MKNIVNKLKENKKILIPSLLVIMFTITLVVILSNKSTMASSDKDLLSLTCPEIVSAGDIISCTITLDTETIKGMGFETHLETSDNLTFDSYEVNTIDNKWNTGTGSSTAIVHYNFEEIQGNYILGTLKYKVSEDAKPNEKFYVSLTSNLLSGNNDNGETTEVILDDVKIEFRTLSDINTLDGISLSMGTLNETFNSGTTSYTANIDSDKVTITTTRTDSNSTVTGDGEVNLHYGTNNIVITVTSELGTTKDYTVVIKRNYEFTSDNYIYNKDNNYIYTKMDSDSTTIKSNINNLPNELTSVIENNKLIIKYSDEVLLSINIINLSSSKYSITNNKIRIGMNVSYEEFINNITTNGVTFKLFDDSNEITSGTLEENNKLKVYYEGNLLEEYNITLEYLNFSDKLNVDSSSDNKMIKRLKVNTTYSELKEEISTSGTITIYNGKDNTKLNDSDKVKTGDILEVKLQDSTIKYTISVLGDISGSVTKSGKVLGDGIIDVGDVGQLYRYLKGKTEFEDYQISAGDILSDSSIKVNDVARLYRYIKGKNSTLEVE